MRDDQLLRYSRHILLDEWGVEGQERVSQSHALIVGAGGLGSPAALYLASAGVGHISLIDHDHVDVTNLQRQIAHSQARVGQLKVASLQAAMQAINPEVQVSCYSQKADAAFERVLVASPTYHEAYLYRARTNRLLEKDDVMTKNYEDYVAKVSENLKSKLDSANANLATNKSIEELYKGTVQDFNNSVYKSEVDKLKPKLIESYNNIAANYANTDKAKAIEYFRKTLALDPANAYATESMKTLK